MKGDTVKGYDRELRFFCLYLRSPQIENITIDDVMGYLNGMAELGWDRNSFIGKCSALRKFFEFWWDREYKVLNPALIPIPRQEQKLPRVADEQQYQKLLTVIPKETNDPRHIRNLAIITLFWDTGARNGEILGLNVGDVDTAKRVAVIRTEKAVIHRPFRQIFWTEETNGYLMAWLKKRAELEKKMKLEEEGALFISICGSMYNTSGRRLTLKGSGEMLRRYCNRARIPYMNAHSFRHRMGHHIVKSGGSASDVMNILGHASVQSTTIYTMMAGQELKERWEKFNSDEKLSTEKITKT